MHYPTKINELSLINFFKKKPPFPPKPKMNWLACKRLSMCSKMSYYNSRIVGQSFRLGWLEGETHCQKKVSRRHYPTVAFANHTGAVDQQKWGRAPPYLEGRKPELSQAGRRPASTVVTGHRTLISWGSKAPPSVPTPVVDRLLLLISAIAAGQLSIESSKFTFLRG